jgi:hypothetical protein
LAEILAVALDISGQVQYSFAFESVIIRRPSLF